MKNNDGFENIYSNSFNDDARAVSESELLPIYEGMEFSGDIQPVEDIEITKYEKIKGSEDKNDNQKNDSKKKKTSLKSIFNKHKKQIIAGAIAFLLIVAIVVAVVLIIKTGKNDSPVKTVYSTGESIEIVLENGKEYEIKEADNVAVSEDGMMLYYGSKTDSQTGKFDLKVVDVKSKDSLRKGGAFIENGIDEGWSVNSDGSFVCYTKTENGVKDCYMYSAEEGKSQLVSNNVNEVFLPSQGDVVYFTRKISSVYSLHRMRYGEESVSVYSGISHALFYDSPERFEVLYTVETGKETNVDVYSVTDYDEPKKVCSEISELFANDYEASGNLYYFKKNSSKINWRDFIDDPNYESDAKMTRPVEGDYMVNIGIIFDRYVVDRQAFNAANKAYEAKLLRDSIREELDRIDLGLAVQNAYSCYVYNGMTKELATGLNIENVLCYAPEAAPRIIYAKSAVEVDGKISFDTLVKYAKQEDVSAAVDYVTEKIGNDRALSNECIYSWYDSTRVLSYPVKGYDVEKTTFILGTKDYFYALEDGKLYSNQVTTKEVKSRSLVDSNVTKCEFAEGYLYYFKEEADGKTSLYRCSPSSGKQHLADNVYEYHIIEKEYVLLLCKQSSGAELMNIAVFSEGKYNEIDKDVSLRNFVYNGKSLSYLKNTGSYENFNSGDMYIYNPEDGVQKAKNEVVTIFHISKS